MEREVCDLQTMRAVLLLPHPLSQTEALTWGTGEIPYLVFKMHILFKYSKYHLQYLKRRD